MKIMLFALTDTYESLIPKLEEKGYEYKLFNQYSLKGQNLYMAAPKSIEWVNNEIRKFSPDLIINNMPGLSLPKSHNYTYFGNNEESANLELHKWETRKKAESHGFILPEVLAECHFHDMPPFPHTVYLKSKGRDIFCQSWKVPAGTNMENMRNMFVAMCDGHTYPAYVESPVKFDVEGYCQFRVSNNSYTITEMKGSHGILDDYKSVENCIDQDWRKNSWMQDLSPDHYKVFREKCESWLGYVSTLGGNYEGNIGAAIDENLNVYWFEQNSRHMTFTTFKGDVDSWIESFTTNTDENFWALYE